jgi:RNA polymerase sigma factor (sigma-70 family)
LVEPNQIAATQAVASSMPEICPPSVPVGFEEYFRESFRELVRTAMYAGANRHEAEDAAAKTLMEMLPDWGARERSLTYARTAVVHNFIKAKTRGTPRLAQRLIERGHVPCQEGAEDSQLTVWEDDEWVADVLSVLPPAQRKVMELIVKGLDRDEIAETLGKTKEAIRRHLCDARARLSRELNANGDRRQNPVGDHKQQPPRRTARTPREEAR